MVSFVENILVFFTYIFRAEPTPRILLNLRVQSINAMSTIRTIFDIIFFKAKPSDTPFNINATTLAFASAWFTSLLSASLQPNHPNPIIFTLIQIGSYGAMLAFFLSINKKQNRIHQTLLASYGTLAIINTIIFIFLLIGMPILVLPIAIWSFIIQMYILKHSLDTGFGQAFFMVITIQLTILILISFVFPEHFKEHLEAMQKLQSQS